MWVCPKCGRGFKRVDQGHYCGKAPETVEEYIRSQPAEAQPHLMELRRIICGSVPGVRERIAWSMPVYEKDGRSISFAACKNHISFYADMEVLKVFQPQLNGFAVKKSAVYLPHDKAIPTKVIENIVMQCFDEK